MITSWAEVTNSNPEHSKNYIARWESFEKEGRDINGEARLIDALAPDGARILDAGAGTGRLGGYLAARYPGDSTGSAAGTGRTLHVSGVDIDPVLVNYARSRYPSVDWHIGDLSHDAEVPPGPFDLIVAAGNVLAFIPDPAHRDALGVLRRRLAPGGRLIVGFGLHRGRSRAEFDADAAEANLRIEQEFSSWDLRPADPDTGFIVAILVATDDAATTDGQTHHA